MSRDRDTAHRLRTAMITRVDALAGKRAAIRRRSLSLVFLSALSGLAHAEIENEWAVRAGATYSDNFNRAAAGGSSRLAPEAGLLLALGEERERLEYRVSANLSYFGQDFANSSDRIEGAATADLRAVVVPDILSWTVYDTFGKALQNGAGLDSPGNRENVNFFSTGPALTIPLGARLVLDASATWSQTDFSESDTDTEARGGSLALRRRISRRSTLGLGLSADRIEFTEADSTIAYDVQRATLEWEGSGSQTEASATVGYSIVRDGTIDGGGLVARFSLTRQLSVRSSLELEAGTDLIDGREVFRTNQLFAGGTRPTTALPVNVGPTRNDFARLSWSARGSRFDLGTGVYWQSNRAELLGVGDIDELGMTLSFGRALTPRLRIALGGGYARRDGVETATADEFTGRVEAGLTIRRNVSLGFSIDRYHGTARGVVGTVTENRASLTIGYSPSGR